MLLTTNEVEKCILSRGINSYASYFNRSVINIGNSFDFSVNEFLGVDKKFMVST